ncbi:MAG: VOC family protein [Dehalococcoidia bacterium]
MKANQLIVNITSENADELKRFYKDIVQLEPDPNIGEDGAFKVGDAAFVIDGHSDVRGRAKEPARALINFMVDDIASEEQRLKDAGVNVVRSQGKEFWGGIISTFEDPDGNYFQMIEYRPE